MKALIANIRCEGCLRRLKVREIRETASFTLRHVELFCESQHCKFYNKLYRLPTIQLVPAGTPYDREPIRN